MSTNNVDRIARANQRIYSQSLILEPIAVDHARELFDDLQAPELYLYTPDDPPTSSGELEGRYIRWSKRTSSSGDEIWYNYALRLTDGQEDDQEYVGTLQATAKNTGEALIAYQVFPRYWRRGIAREGCRVMIEKLFKDGSTKMIAQIDTRNIASQRLVESLGFVRTDRINNADTFKGTVSDEYVYELLPAMGAHAR
ncbi:MAG TPA: GNAT family protein [Kofleriaceae bacterium]|nr:GNAT family protein [Kofleriaceae bacterium]